MENINVNDMSIQDITKQIKEILPELIGAKEILGEASKMPDKVKDLYAQLQKMEGNIFDLGKKVVELGNKKIPIIPAKGMDNESKIDFCKYLIQVYKMKSGQTEGGMKLLKDLHTKYSTKASLSETVGSTGGTYLFPEMFRDQIWYTAEQESQILKKCAQVPLTPGYKLPIMTMSTKPTVDFVDDEGTVQESEPVFARQQILAKKLMAYTAIDNELLEDEEVGLVDFLINIFGQAIGVKIDQTGFCSDGPRFTGIMYQDGVNMVTATSGLGTFDKAATGDMLSSMIAQIKPFNLVGAEFYLHRTVLQYLRIQKANTAGVYMWQAMDSSSPATIWSYPYNVCEQMPSTSSSAVNTPFIIFGNMKNFLVGTKGDTTIFMTNIPKILTDQSIIVFRRRFAMGVGLPESFSVLKTAPSNS